MTSTQTKSINYPQTVTIELYKCGHILCIEKPGVQEQER